MKEKEKFQLLVMNKFNYYNKTNKLKFSSILISFLFFNKIAFIFFYLFPLVLPKQISNISLITNIFSKYSNFDNVINFMY
jgi:hypothetical protein